MSCKQNPDYVKSRRAGIVYGFISLLSFWIYAEVTALLGYLLPNLGSNSRYVVLGGAPIAITRAILTFKRAMRERQKALRIRYPEGIYTKG